MKKITSLLLAVTLICALGLPAIAVDDPAFSVKIVGDIDTAAQFGGQGTFSVSWQITANRPNLTLTNTQGLRIAYDNTVLQLIRWNAASAYADNTIGTTFASMAGAGSFGDFESDILRVYAARNASGDTGFLNLAVGDESSFYTCVQGEIVPLIFIRFAFREGKSEADLVPGSIRAMTASELAATSQSSCVLINVQAPGGQTTISHQYLAQQGGIPIGNDTLNPPTFELVPPITIEIPDPNFRAAVYQRIGKTSPEPIYATDVEKIFILDVTKRDIQSLAGLEWFTGLQWLYCSSNELAELPLLPSSLTYLSCGYNQLTSLPVLPSGLRDLSCSGNQLTSLPVLPSGLSLLYCSYNQLTSLPLLPSGLTLFSCDNNQLTSLPVLPSSLDGLDCSDNQLTSLPVLPSSMDWLYCSGNQLTSLPVLPSSLYLLYCNDNQLTSLDITGLNLKFLDCSYNYMADESAVIGFTGTWDDYDFFFSPQKTMAKAATPTANPSGGQIAVGTTVTLSCATAGATIRYTTNGSDPTASSPVYSSPIVINSNTTLKARAFVSGSGMTDSDVATFVYTVIPGLDALTFTVDSVTTHAGGYVEVPIRITNNPGIASIIELQISWDNSKLMYDDRLGAYNPANDTTGRATWPFTVSGVGGTKGVFQELSFSAPVEGTTKTDSFISFNISTIKNSYEDDLLLTLKLKVKDGADPGLIDLIMSIEDVEDDNKLGVPFNLVNGAIAVSNILYGDVNNDGVVDVFDSLYLARHLAEWPGYETVTLTADADGNGVVDVFDALYLARHLVEWPGYETLGPK